MDPFHIFEEMLGAFIWWHPIEEIEDQGRKIIKKKRNGLPTTKIEN